MVEARQIARAAEYLIETLVFRVKTWMPELKKRLPVVPVIVSEGVTGELTREGL